MNLLSDNKIELLLALDGTEEALQIILAKREEPEEPFSLLDARTLVVPGRSAFFMVPAIKNALDLFGFSAKEITHLACVAGPGSFTGLRLTFSAAAGIISGNKALITGLEYLPMLAAGPAKFTRHPLWVVTHSRRMQVYIQGFEPLSEGKKNPEPLTPVLPVPVTEAVQIIESYKQERAVILGSGLLKNKAFFDDFLAANPQLKTLPKRFNRPALQDILSAADAAEFGTEMPFPMYLRGSDAEDNLEAITKKLGIPLEAARKLLKDISPV
ncbi:tRNA (adenosine(37)-N6)-threonylcarbamoyltransferase complex dimerization subunit type 1 TsaB [Maridesulfovibrio ferrireducens]|uniref:tRNA (adenosine(37)-N6)-threonylcarbamoyltransferase complex dimerization subunit type 1 TsaB n=1 Tax=Maridesulfovibrio ferrireducens TaxID=246191 RepID=UPI001A236E06|nr:tRNA (adenosine(37)-N6)-threonylcarbamoyltransferase complex dimerization subunit type 1 TsaB [Maridesulfovibrio ferrireducens]MBI9111034.1 tRNA (adenosine(37)-N6)-threonylcarbamoyltransferase complex dimerization subunit type 1 TsaB [Maridesulfovibrio ferrireducens]